MKKKETLTQINNIQENNEFLFFSAGIGKRILSFLADIFICFIVSVFVFEIILFPIVKSFISYDNKVQEITVNHHARVQLMYDNEFLFYDLKDENSKFVVETNISYTGDEFLRFYVFKEDSDAVKRDPIITYWTKVAVNKKDIKSVNQLYSGTTLSSPYFEPNKNDDVGYLILKEEFKTKFAPYFDKNDQVSDTIVQEINAFKRGIFEINFQTVIQDFAETNKTYISYTNNITKIYDEFDMYYQITTVISFLLVVLMLYLIIPCIDKKGRTLGKMVLKLNVISAKTFEFPKIRSKISLFLLNVLENLFVVLFVPFISVGFSSLFGLTYLLVLTICSFVYMLVSFIVCVANKYGKSTKEILTRTIVCEQELIDAYYREVIYEKK